MIGRWALFLVAFVAGIVGATAASYWLPEEPPEVLVPLPAPTVTVRAKPQAEDPYPRGIEPASILSEVSFEPDESPQGESLIPRGARLEKLRMGSDGAVVTWTESQPSLMGLAIWAGEESGAWRSMFVVQEQILGCRRWHPSVSRRQGRSWADFSCTEELGTLIGSPRSPRVEPTVCGPSIDSKLGFVIEDLTGDGSGDVFVSQGGCGSGGYTAWRVIADIGEGWQQIFRHVAGDTQVRARRGTLSMRESVYTKDDPHCCPSAFRLTTLRWDGSDFQETRSRTVPAG